MGDVSYLVFMGLLLFAAVTLATGGAPILLPIVLLAAWLEDRGKTKRILAKARLLEAQNAARKAQEPPHDGS